MRNRRGHHSFVHILFFLALTVSFVCAGTILVWFVTADIPSIDGFSNRRVVESTKIYDRTGKVLLYDVYGTVRRTVVPIEEISLYARNATIAIEDTEFYQHRGIKPLAILRALIANIQAGNKSQGGSTITQQVIKNTVLSREKTYTRKVKEAVLAIKLERRMSKDNILEIYFNETPYGGTIYGIEEASQYYFAKPAKELTLPEAAYLAALPQAPTYYSPFGNHRDELEARKNLVLQRMFEGGFIDADEYQRARGAAVEFQARDDTGIKAPHFVFYVREYLEERYGAAMVNEGGLSVITTLDYDLQKKAEEVVGRRALENEEKFNAENAGLVALDPATGQILAMVGSRGYFDDAIDGKFNLALAKRQPGSAFKPFVYAAAFAKGYTPDTVIFDVKTQFSTTCAPDKFETSNECYSPDNYDGVFRGPVTMRNALAQSINTPAVKVLYLVGIPNALETARRMGITTLEKNQAYYGFPLVLVGGEVTLLEMTSAYGVFANDGVRHEATSILKVEDANGEVLEEYQDNVGERVLEEGVTRTINDVLSDNAARAPAFGEASGLYFPGFQVAAKTGTTNDYRDAWIIGYTPNIAIGAWAGNNNNTPMEKKVAGFIVAPLWNEVMGYVLSRADTPPPLFPTTEQKDTATLPAMLRGVWNEVGPHSILYSVNKDYPLLPPTAIQKLDPQLERWEYAVALWAGLNISSSTPTTTPAVTQKTSAAAMLITYPQEGAVVSPDSFLTITTQSPFGERTKKVSFLLNGVFLGASTKIPFSLTVSPPPPGRVTLQAIAESDSGRVVDEVRFIIR